MKRPSTDRLDPEALARLGSLELVARRIVEGYLAGRHRSPYHGFSVEYADRRPYVPGDELRSLDWRILARTDKYFVRLYEAETNLRAMILVDASRSMAFGSGEVTKFDHAIRLAAALAYLLLRQNDAVGTLLFDEEVRSFVPPDANPRWFHRIAATLAEARPTGGSDLAEALGYVADRFRKRGFVVVLSDLLEENEAIVNQFRRLRSARHEVVVFHVLDPAERTLPIRGARRFRDMETGRTLVANADAIRRRYIERLEAFVRGWRERMNATGVTYEPAHVDEPPDRLLARFLAKRARMA